MRYIFFYIFIYIFLYKNFFFPYKNIFSANNIYFVKNTNIFFKKNNFFFNLVLQQMNNHRRDNFQSTNFDHFNIKSWRTKVNRIYIDQNVFTALTYLGFHIEQNVKKYIHVYCFLACFLFLLVD